MDKKPEQKIVKQEVFCSKCAHYKSGVQFERSGDCLHPSNYDIVAKDWYEVTLLNKKAIPKDLNKKNDCKNFNSKEN